MKEDTNKMIAISALFTQKFKSLRYHDAVPNINHGQSNTLERRAHFY